MTDFSSIRKKVDFYDDGECRIKLCLGLTLHSSVSFKENTAGILDFYAESLGLIKSHITRYDVDGNEQFKKIKNKAFDLLPFWASDDCEERDLYGLTLDNGNDESGLSDYSFDLFEFTNPLYVRLVLPLEFIEPGPEAFLQLAKQASQRFRLISGDAGFCTHMDPDFPSEREGGHIYALSRRFHGIDFGHVTAFGHCMGDGIRGINWLTFVGEEGLKLVGGKSGLRTKLSKEIIIHDLDHGLMIQAGPTPGFGDVNRQDRLPLYHEVGRALTALRIPDEVLLETNHIGGKENTRAWLDRFYDLD